MKFPHGEAVTRHVFARFDHHPWGESTKKIFGSDVEFVAGIDPGGSVEPGTESTVTTTPTLYLEALSGSSAHDEWTVRGERFEQDGDAAVWRSPFTGWSPGVVVRLKRRAG